MPTPEQYVSGLPEKPSHVPKRRRRGGAKRFFATLVKFLLLLSLIVLLTGVGYIGYLAINVAKISTQPLQLGGLVTDTTGRVNVLVLGVGDPGHSGEGLSDTTMVLSLDTRTKRVAQIGIPRDLRVKIPGYGYNKINTAHAYGGVVLAQQVVANTLGIPIHYYIKTDFKGLQQLVDAVGGIDVDVKDRLYDVEYPCSHDQYKICGLDIQPGQQHMDGATALQYARCRKGTCGDDFGRAERQQEVMNLVRDKVVRWDMLLRPDDLFRVVAAVRDRVETNMGAAQLLLFARSWREAADKDPVRFVLSTEQGGLLTVDTASSDLLPIGGDFDRVQERAAGIFDEPADSAK
jgi:LCP family protein required for cell wall assembly